MKIKIKEQLRAARTLFRIRFFRSRFPVVATWSITDRCNYRCKYCDRWRRNSPEISTRDVFCIIDQLRKLHCARISFSGGEPLLREDMGEIISYCGEKGIACTVISNGSLIEKNIAVLEDVDLLELSLDGPREINDSIRGKGAYEKTLTAIKIAKNKGVKVILSSVLTKHNLDCADFFLDIARRFEIGLTFGPVGYIHSRDEIIDFLAPEKTRLNQFVDRLIYEKKAGRPILNSMAALRYMKGFPAPQAIPCFAGKAFCHISANGAVYPCVKMENLKSNCKTGNFREAFKSLPRDNYCTGCWCMGTLELNRLLAFELSVIPEFMKLS